ncbi:unnamed protein product [Rhizoctonia solani]|uniref:Uncharacterized protein n=1 Tax=Rhizoctonia solani TaxID=456999 RepID=A0A8H3D674_9AGAM|nr:unnamed protein product [Rhizoctonia solani]
MGNVAAKLRPVGRAIERGWNSFHSWVSQPHIQRRLWIAAGVGAVVAILVPLTIATLGFGPAGVAAGSAAAAWQAAVYGGLVPAGSIFAILQYLGMTAGGIHLGLAAGGAAAVGVVAAPAARDMVSSVMTSIRRQVLRLASLIRKRMGWHHA